MFEKIYLAGQSSEELEAHIMQIKGDKTGLYLIGQGMQQPFWQDGWVWLADYSWNVDSRNTFLQDEFERYHRIQEAKWAICDALERGFGLNECLWSHDAALDIAQNLNTPSDWLAILAHHSDYEVRHGVAYNRNTLPFDLIPLAHDAYDDVRRSVALNPNSPSEALISLVTDMFNIVYHIPHHPNITIEALQILAQHEHLFVRLRAVSQLAKLIARPLVQLELL
jgi:hypothetical protein